MLIKMQTIYDTPKLNGYTPDSFCHYFYSALKTGPNADFNSCMDRIIDDFQSGNGFNKDIIANKLIIAAHTKYNDMIKDKTWGKVDPHDAKILALTTKLEKLEKEGATKPNAAMNEADSKTQGGEKRFNPLEEWREKFGGDTEEVNGCTYWWCKNHKTKEYDSIYLSSHSPVNHNVWSKDKKDCTGKYHLTTPVTADASKLTTNAPKSSLGLNDCL